MLFSNPGFPIEPFFAKHLFKVSFLLREFHFLQRVLVSQLLFQCTVFIELRGEPSLSSRYHGVLMCFGHFIGKVAAKKRIGSSDFVRNAIAFARRKKLLQKWRLVWAVRQHAQAMTMGKLEAWMAGFEFRPKLKDAEASFSNVRIVEQDDGAVRQLGAPGFKIVFNVLVEVAAVDMQEIDAAILKMGQSAVESGAHDSRKGAVAFVIGTQLFKYFFPVETGMLVAFPGIDAKCLCI